MFMFQVMNHINIVLHWAGSYTRNILKKTLPIFQPLLHNALLAKQVCAICEALIMDSCNDFAKLTLKELSLELSTLL